MPTLQDLVDPLDEPVAVAHRHAEHVGDDAHRDVAGVVLGGVAAPVGDEVVDQRVADPARHRLQLADLLRREEGQQHLLVRLVLRRVGGDRRRRQRRVLVFLVAQEDAARREMLGIVGDGLDVLVAGRQPGALEALGAGDRALAQLVPDREGIVAPLRIEMVPVGAPVRDRRPFERLVRGLPGRRLGRLPGRLPPRPPCRVPARPASRPFSRSSRILHDLDGVFRAAGHGQAGLRFQSRAARRRHPTAVALPKSSSANSSGASAWQRLWPSQRSGSTRTSHYSRFPCDSVVTSAFPFARMFHRPAEKGKGAA